MKRYWLIFALVYVGLCIVLWPYVNGIQFVGIAMVAVAVALIGSDI